jgi:hypothetical protein
MIDKEGIREKWASAYLSFPFATESTLSSDDLPFDCCSTSAFMLLVTLSFEA